MWNRNFAVRSRRRTAWLHRMAVAVLICAVGTAASQPESAPSPASSSPAAALSPATATGGSAGTASATLDEIERQVQVLRDEQHFGRKHPERYIRVKPDSPSKDKPALDKSGAWWRGFSLWLSQIGRVGIWTLGAVAVAVLMVLVLRAWRQSAADVAIDLPGTAPGRVREYDIRPESLPADVGAAVRKQWRAGEQRAALALLYRAALSVLVHRHAVPIRASSTEGDCARLVAGHLDSARSEYFERVTRARLLSTYAGRWPDDAEVMSLSDTFEDCFVGTTTVRPEATA